MAKEFRVAHAEIRQEGLWQHVASDDFRVALETSWVAGTQVTRYGRTWRLSRRRQGNGLWAGQIGFVKVGEVSTWAWDDSIKDFERGEADSGVVVPFIVDLENRVVSFPLTAGTVRPTTVTSNLEALLNVEGTYLWVIAPLSFRMEFDDWRQTVARVSHIKARLEYPNPNWTGRDNLASMMDGFNAHAMRLIATAPDESSLDTESPWFQQTMDHVRQGYGRAEMSGPDLSTGTESRFVISETGGLVQAISKITAQDDTATQISAAELRETQAQLLELDPSELLTINPDEDSDDDDESS